MRNVIELTEDDVRAACMAYVLNKYPGSDIADISFTIGVYEYGDVVEFEGAEVTISEPEPEPYWPSSH
jgi:hypothetical protein